MGIRVKANIKYFDTVIDRVVHAGEIFEVTEDRFKILIDRPLPLVSETKDVDTSESPIATLQKLVEEKKATKAEFKPRKSYGKHSKTVNKKVDKVKK